MMMPFVRKNIVEPIYTFKNNSPKRKYWKVLEETQFLSEEELKKIQWERMLNIIHFAYNNNGFYRKRFDENKIHPEDIKTPKEIKYIPILTKEEIRNNVTNLISDGHAMRNLLKFKTGGSTGKPLELYITEDLSELRNACARRHDRWTGWEVGEPVGALWGNPVLPRSLKARLKNLLISPCIYLDTMNVNIETVKTFCNQWNTLKPTLLFGHAHSIYLLTKFLKEFNLLFHEPKAIISTSMMLLPHERRYIEDFFGKKVFDRYGCEEVSLIASECEKHEGMHLNIEHLYIEFIKEDGCEANNGEQGNVIVTDLMNEAMPFIRYQVEDIGIPTEKKCSCERGLPLMETVGGRVSDFLIKSDGTRVAGVSLIENTLTRVPGIAQMQIVQESFGKFYLNIVPTDKFNDKEIKRLVEYFKNIFGIETSIETVILKEIKSEKSGKYRFSICKVK